MEDSAEVKDQNLVHGEKTYLMFYSNLSSGLEYGMKILQMESACLALGMRKVMTKGAIALP